MSIDDRVYVLETKLSELQGTIQQIQVQGILDQLERIEEKLIRLEIDRDTFEQRFEEANARLHYLGARVDRVVTIINKLRRALDEDTS